jgi:hypothetical protein
MPKSAITYQLRLEKCVFGRTFQGIFAVCTPSFGQSALGSAQCTIVSLSPVNIMDRGISDFLCGLHRLWIVCKASLDALEELLHHLCRHAISYGLMRAEATVVRLD